MNGLDIVQVGLQQQSTISESNLRGRRNSYILLYEGMINLAKEVAMQLTSKSPNFSIPKPSFLSIFGSSHFPAIIYIMRFDLEVETPP